MGIDITPQMIDEANKRHLQGVKFLVGDCENLPFDNNSFDVVICSHSFHHYPHPEKFFHSVSRVLKPKGRFILQENTHSFLRRLYINYVKWPLARLRRLQGDVKVYSKVDIVALSREAGLVLEKYTDYHNSRMQCLIRKL